ncbi:MAG: FUSC family protein, partial [Rhizomicrobium sp.]
AIPERLEVLLKEIADWLDAPFDEIHTGQIALQKKCLELKHIKGVPAWRDLLLYNVMARMVDLIDVYASCRMMVHQFSTRVTDGAAIKPLRRVNRNRTLHRDYGAAWRAAISAVAIVFIGCLIWIVTGWPDGSIAVMMATVVYCFFVSRANPVMAQKSFLYQALLASIVAGIYLFAILPQTHSFASLALAFSPVLLIAGILLAKPVVGVQYMAFIANFCASLTLTEHFAPDIQSYINRSIAQFVGIASVIAVTSILHHSDAQRYISKSLRTTWTDISRLALGTRRFSSGVWTSLMVDRIGLMAPYVGAIRGSKQYKSVNAMQELRVGLNIIRLSRAAERLAPDQFWDVQDLLSSIGAYFAYLASQGAYSAPSETILRKIDAEIATLSGLPSNKLKETILNALTGLRCNLFPDAWEYMYGINWHD